MAKIKRLEIKNFRGISSLVWYPNDGMNCLVGPGDSTKSTILIAIELVLHPRYWSRFSDTDFYMLDSSQPIFIEVIIGDLSDILKNLDSYGDYLQGYDAVLGVLEDEPGADTETVLVQSLKVGHDLEPEWQLTSERTKERDSSRRLRRDDAKAVAPIRIGSTSEQHFAWRDRSILYRLDDVRPNASAALAKAARDARDSFKTQADTDLAAPLDKVNAVATSLNIDLNGGAAALLDAQGIQLSNGGVALHDGNSVPLRCLGTGSSRLLISGLVNAADEDNSIVLADEIESGLEPHRAVRLVKTLKTNTGGKSVQVFATSHSPTVIRELEARELAIVKTDADKIFIKRPGPKDQGTIRRFAEGFLSPKVIICEGATEVGYLRGLDAWKISDENVWVSASGVTLLDCGGGDAARPYSYAKVFLDLGYKVAIFRDDDLPVPPPLDALLSGAGGHLMTWASGQSLEIAMFHGVDIGTIGLLLDYVEGLHGAQKIDGHIQTFSNNVQSMATVRAEIATGVASEATRAILASASSNKSNPWFKRISWMEDAGREILLPRYHLFSDIYKGQIWNMIKWCFE